MRHSIPLRYHAAAVELKRCGAGALSSGYTVAFRFIRLCLCAAAMANGTRASEIVILHTADVHGHVFNAGLCGEAREEGGLLRCAALVKSVRKSSPDAVLLDIGDVFQGTAESRRSRGLLVAEIISAMDYDGLVPGNHEFDWGIEALLKFYEKAGAKVLAADIFTADAAHFTQAGLWPASQQQDLRPPGFQPFFVKNIQGARLAVIGLSNQHMPRWFKPESLGQWLFFDSIEAIRGILNSVRAAKPDIIVLAVHQGYRDWGDNPANRINEIAANFPEFTAIIGAHTHNAAPMEEINGVLYTQAPPYARSLGKITITFDVKRKRIVRRHAELLPADAAVPPEPELAARCEKVRRQTEEYLDETIGSAACDHSPAPVSPGQSRIQSLIAAAVAERTGADAVLHGALADAALYAGKVRMRDVWRVLPYENNIGVARLTADEIEEILAENSRYYNSPQFRGVYGLTYRLAFDSRLPRISDVSIGGRPAERGGRRYTIAFNSFDLASAGDRLPRLREITERPASALRDTGWDTRQIVIDYITAHPDFDILNVPPAAGAVVAPDTAVRPERERKKSN